MVAKSANKVNAEIRKRWVSAIREDTELSVACCAVAFVLFFYSNAKHGACFPSIGTIARETGADPKTVTRAIKKLTARGWLSCSKSIGRAHHYTFLIPSPKLGQVRESKPSPNLVHVPKSTHPKNGSPPRPELGHHLAQKRATNQLSNQLSNQQERETYETLPHEWRVWAERRRPDLNLSLDAIFEKFEIRKGPIAEHDFGRWKTWVIDERAPRAKSKGELRRSYEDQAKSWLPEKLKEINARQLEQWEQWAKVHAPARPGESMQEWKLRAQRELKQDQRRRDETAEAEPNPFN